VVDGAKFEGRRGVKRGREDGEGVIGKKERRARKKTVSMR
jgi:hypothetical protein